MPSMSTNYVHMRLLKACSVLSFLLPAASALHMHHNHPQGVRQQGGARGHLLAGVNVKAAGVVPYMRTAEGNVFFLMQEMVNGSRTGQLCDFGGRREREDSDLYETAARELTEETCGAFGSVQGIAQRLRHERTVRILNPVGKYLTFFLKVKIPEGQEPEQLISEVDHASTDFAARDCRWFGVEELLAEEARVQGRLLNHNGVNDGRSRGGGSSGFDFAVRKTLSLEMQRTKNRRGGRSVDAVSLGGGAPLSIQVPRSASEPLGGGRPQRYRGMTMSP